MLSTVVEAGVFRLWLDDMAVKLTRGCCTGPSMFSSEAIPSVGGAMFVFSENEYTLESIYSVN